MGEKLITAEQKRRAEFVRVAHIYRMGGEAAQAQIHQVVRHFESLLADTADVTHRLVNAAPGATTDEFQFTRTDGSVRAISREEYLEHSDLAAIMAHDLHEMYEVLVLIDAGEEFRTYGERWLRLAVKRAVAAYEISDLAKEYAVQENDTEDDGDQ